MDIHYIIYGILFNLLGLVNSSLIYKLLVRYMHGRISLKDSFLITNMLAFTNYIIPFKGNQFMLKPFFTKKYTGFSLSKSVLLTFIEQLFTLLFQIILILLALIFLGETEIINNSNTRIILFLLIVAIIFIALTKYKKIIRICFKFKFLLPKKLKNKLSEETFEDKLGLVKKYLYNKKIIVMFLITSITLMIIQPFMLYYAIKLFTNTVTYKVAFIIYWIAFMAGRFSGLPAGLGVRDVTLVVLLKLYGFANLDVVQIILMYRLIAAIPHFAIGGPSFLYLGGKKMLKMIKKDSSEDN